MNGIDPVIIATGNDWRAIEAGAHAYAARDGRYRPLGRWVVKDGALHGSIELPMQVKLMQKSADLNLFLVNFLCNTAVGWCQTLILIQLNRCR
jgi:hypothetical protein